jgi:hypothetical protein
MIDPTEIMSPLADVKMPVFPTAEASATNKTNIVDHIGGTPVIYLAAAVPGKTNPTAVLPAVLPATQEGTTPSVAQRLSLSQEGPLEDSSDNEVCPATKKGRKSSRRGNK